MEIEQLRYFTAAAQEHSFAKAAKKCFTTRQNVSRSIKDLEKELRASLFTRKGNSMQLTPLGEVVAREAQSILDIEENMHLLCQEPSQAQPPIRISISHNLFSGAPKEISVAVERRIISSKIVEVSGKECYERVRDGRSDVAIVSSMKQDFPGCNSQLISISAAYLLVGEKSKLARRTTYSLADLRDIPFVLMPDPQFQYKPLFDLLGSLNFSEDRVSTVTSTGSMLHIIKRSDTGAIVTDTYSASTPPGTLAIPINDPRLNWHIYAVYATTSDNFITINRFINELKGNAETLD